MMTQTYNPKNYTDEQVGAIGEAIADCIGSAIDHGLTLNLVTLATVQEWQAGLLGVTVHATDAEGNEVDSHVLIEEDGHYDLPQVGRLYN